jgi:hypothetical protein
MSTSAPPLWATRLRAELAHSDTRVRALARDLDQAQLNWRRAPHEWSIGQCLDHLATANEVYLASITDALADAPPGYAAVIRPGWFGRWFIRSYMEPGAATRRRKAPRKIKPNTTVDAAVLDRFLRSNNLVREVIARASAYDVNRIRFRNPFVPLIRFTVGTGLEILSAHERRHLLQAERIRQSLP